MYIIYIIYIHIHIYIYIHIYIHIHIYIYTYIGNKAVELQKFELSKEERESVKDD